MRKVFGIVLILVIVSLSAFVLHLQISGQIKFVPDRFAEEFLKFLANLASIFFGFYLVNVYWEQKEKRQQRSQVRRVLLSYLLRINRISLRILDLLSRHYSEAELEHSRTRDAEIASLVDKIEKITDGLESFAFDSAMLGDIILQKISVEVIREGLLTELDKLVDQQNFRKSFETFVVTIKTIEKYTSEGINYLSRR